MAGVNNETFGDCRTAVLHIDDRERAISVHREVFAELPIVISRMTIGDYAITYGGSVVAVFERKTLDDLAASIKDGRYDNKNSLIDIREKSGCRVYYIIEGKMPKSPDVKVGGIPFACLESALDHLVIRDGFNILYTKDAISTARRLYRFSKSVQTLINKRELDFVDGVTEHLLTEKRELNDDDVVRSMWCKFRGIAATIADVFMERYSLEDVVRGRVTADALAGIKMPDGRAVGKRVVSSLTGAIDTATQVKLLACVPGVSVNMAGQILKGRTLASLLSYDVGAIGIISVGRPAKKLGDTRAARIKKYFGHKLIAKPAEVPAVPAATVAPAAPLPDIMMTEDDFAALLN